MASSLTVNLTESEFCDLANKGCSFSIAMRPHRDFTKGEMHYETMQLPFVVVNNVSMAYSHPNHIVISDKDFMPLEKNLNLPVQATWIYGWINDEPMFFNIYMDGGKPYLYTTDRYEKLEWRVEHWRECDNPIETVKNALPLRVILWKDETMMSLPVQLPYAMDNGDLVVQTQLFWFVKDAKAMFAQLVIDITNKQFMDLALLEKRQWMPLRKVKLLCQEKS